MGILDRFVLSLIVSHLFASLSRRGVMSRFKGYIGTLQSAFENLNLVFNFPIYYTTYRPQCKETSKSETHWGLETIVGVRVL